MPSANKKIKVAILLLFIGFAIAIFTTNKHFVETTNAFSTGPPAAHTGAPDEQNCTTCHIANAPTGQFTIIAPANYTPGQTYQIQVRHTTTDMSRRRWGFQIVSLANNVQAGTPVSLNASTQSLTVSNRTYIEQTATGTFQDQTGGAIWTYSWTAPATNVGNVTFYAAGNQANNDQTSDGDQLYTTNVVSQPQAAPITHRFSDFDGDGKGDISVFRPTDRVWYLQQSTGGFAGFQFGLATDKLVPADYDGDGKTDVAVFRAGTWYLLRSSLGFTAVQWGNDNDVPLPYDFDGDGKADFGVFRNGTWFVLKSTGGVVTTSWGSAGDKTVVADYDGDGKADYGVFRNGIWFILQSTAGVKTTQWGIATDKTVADDYDGDGKADFAVFRDGFWFVLTAVGTFQGAQWGTSGDIPTPADFDGDGKTDLGVFRNGTWFIQRTTAGVQVFNFGLTNDKPIPNVFVQ